MWRLGFFFHDMAFGLLTVFIPLYVVVFRNTSILGGPLLALGVMTSIAIFCSIPASFLWGYLCDKTRHYKIFVMLSFASIAIILLLMTLPFAQNLITFVILYVAMQMLHVAHESPKNVLVTEHYSRCDWERSFGFYEALTEIGFIIGLAAGMVLFASTVTLSVGSLGANYAFYFCSGLSVVALVLALVLIADPIMVFERRLVCMERKLDFAHKGIEGSSKLMDGLPWEGSLKEDSFKGFAFAIVLFALATSLFFTPLPIYLRELFGGQQQYVYFAYIVNSVGATAGYFLIRAKARSMNVRKQMPRFILVRSLLVFTLVGVIWFAIAPTIITCLLLVCLGFAYAMYYIMMLSLSMEIIPQGKAGLFDGMVSLGAAIGAFLGPFLVTRFSYLPSNFSYLPIFIITAIIFLFAFISLKILR